MKPSLYLKTNRNAEEYFLYGKNVLKSDKICRIARQETECNVLSAGEKKVLHNQ